jgi:hypothetical protein
MQKQHEMLEGEAFSFDENAIVDYHALVGAQVWMGLVTSPMSCLYAYARSVDDGENFFDTYVFPGSERSGFESVIQTARR